MTVNGTGAFGGVIQDGSTASTALTVAGGALTLSGLNTYTGATTISAGTLDVTGSIASTTVSNSGALEFAPTSSTTVIASGGTVTNNACGTVELASNVTATISSAFNNQGGTVDALAGTLILAGGGTSTGGAYNASSGATVDLTGGQFDNSLAPIWTGTYTGSGGGTVLLGGNASNSSGGQIIIGAAGATLDFSGSLFQWTYGKFDLQGNTLTNQGTITLNNAANLSDEVEANNFYANPNTYLVNMGGTLVNTGTILDEGPGDWNFSDGATLQNAFGGTINVDGAAGVISWHGNASYLTNQAGGLFEMTGAGTSQLTLTTTNSGTIAADGGGILTVDPGAVWSSSGTLEACNGSTLVLGGIWSNTGQIGASSGTLDLGSSGADFALDEGTNYSIDPSSTVNIIGTLTSDLDLSSVGGTWQLYGGTLQDGTLTGGPLFATNQGGSLIDYTLAGGSDFDLSNGSVVAYDKLTLDTTLDIGSGDGATAGTLDMQPVAPNSVFTLQSDPGQTGTIVFGPNIDNQIYSGASGETTVIASGITIQGGYGVIGGNDDTLDNYATIEALTASPGGSLECRIRRQRRQLRDHRGLQPGRCRLPLPCESGPPGPPRGGTGTTGWSNGPTGTISIADGVLLLDDQFANRGAVDSNTYGIVEGSYGDFVYSQISGSASTTLNGGELSPNSGLIDIEAGTLTGTGTLNGNLDVDNGGQFNPTGPVTIYGSYTQGEGGAFDVSIGGPNAGTDFPQVTVTGTASFDGTLDVVLLNGYAPALASVFPLMTFTSSSGDFATKTYSDPGSGNILESGYTPSSLLVGVVPAGTTVFWTSSSSGDWSDPSNWSTQAVPGPNDVVFIGVPGVTVTISGAEMVAGLTTLDPINVTGDGSLGTTGGGTVTETASASNPTVDLSSVDSPVVVTIGADATTPITVTGGNDQNTVIETSADLAPTTIYTGGAGSTNDFIIDPVNATTLVNETGAAATVDVSNIEYALPAKDGETPSVSGPTVDFTQTDGQMQYFNLTDVTNAAFFSLLDASQFASLSNASLALMGVFQTVIAGSGATLYAAAASNTAGVAQPGTNVVLMGTDNTVYAPLGSSVQSYSGGNQVIQESDSSQVNAVPDDAAAQGRVTSAAATKSRRLTSRRTPRWGPSSSRRIPRPRANSWARMPCSPPNSSPKMRRRRPSSSGRAPRPTPSTSRRTRRRSPSSSTRTPRQSPSTSRRTR